MISLRRDSDVARHAGKAALAAPTAASTSSTEARSTSACCSPVAGFHTGPVRPDVPATVWPPIQWLMRLMVTSLARFALRSGTGRGPA
jgi:hypothetical protein